ncbi:MAG TPA: 3'-5' exonuclease, partial [Microthrixaceae bacterium]|nr:3'-5' exonuclease [Microthrixaceae bacterium]
AKLTGKNPPPVARPGTLTRVGPSLTAQAKAGNRKTPLFDYGGRGSVNWSSAPLAIVDVETTGLSATNHRIVEIAVSRVENGAVVDEWSSIVNPGCGPGPTWIHGITQDHLDSAPPLADVMGEILQRMDRAIVVAHNAKFEEAFLDAEFRRLGMSMPSMPALCTLTWSRKLLHAPNYKLETCCSVSGVQLTDAHTALGDVRATASLVGSLMELGPGPEWFVMPGRLPSRVVTSNPRTRASRLRKGEDGWMASILSKLPLTSTEADDDVVEAYFRAVSLALEDGKIIGDEAKQLATLAGSAGLGAAQVANLNRRFLDGLREAALEDDLLTVDEHRSLQKAAVALAEPEYFLDLVPAGAPVSAAPVAKAKGRGRIWLHPEISVEYSDRVTDAGFSIGKNVTRTLRAVVVGNDVEACPQLDRARELDVEVVRVWDLSRVLDA